MSQEFGMDEELEATVNEDEEVTLHKDEIPKRKPFATWCVNGDTYRLKLKTGSICQLESKFKRNLLSVLMDNGSGTPPLGVMLTVIQAAMSVMQHQMKFSKVQELFDEYVEEGGTQLTLFTDVIIPIIEVSGFFTVSQAEDVSREMENMRSQM